MIMCLYTEGNMQSSSRKYLAALALFVLGFALALGVGWWWFGRPPEPPAAGARSDGVVREADMAAFLQAARKNDFQTLKDEGDRLFKPGVRVVDSAGLFSQYAVNSFPPYTVYALHTFNGPDITRRVLLTLDDKERVESFMAEEMTVIQ